MSKKEKLILKLLTGRSDANFDLDDLIQILIRLGFEERNSGAVIEYFLKTGLKVS